MAARRAGGLRVSHVLGLDRALQAHLPMTPELAADIRLGLQARTRRAAAARPAPRAP